MKDERLRGLPTRGAARRTDSRGPGPDASAGAGSSSGSSSGSSAGSSSGAGILALLAALAGCATVPPDAGKNPDDPFERVNRQVYAFNDGFDRAIAKPVAQGYSWAVPKPARDCVGNFFANIGEVTSIVNSMLQAKPSDALVDFGRLAVNSTIGLGGCFDVATKIGWERRKQDFGATMGRWGVPTGPYVVLPLLGPSSVRDAIGEVPDYFLDPVVYIKNRPTYYSIYVVRFVDKRAQLLDTGALIQGAALDPYAFLRDGYLQRRRAKDQEGKGAPLPREEDPDAPDPAKPAAPGPAAVVK
jgi:phospholipid-binding lipoprotein MlaA